MVVCGRRLRMNTPGKFNSLLPLGAPAAEAINNLKANVAKLNTTMNQVVQNTQKTMNTAPGGWPGALLMFLALVALFIFVLSYFRTQIKDGYDYFMTNVKQILGYPTDPLGAMGGEQPGQDVLDKPIAPQDITPAEKAISKPIVEKILPNVGAPEVFNVSKNTFTYYDAEPLCRALGAELATYDQVKEAWERGADWCNYGWVKGQAAVYPTQKNTWDRIQAGPEEQRNACGVPGLNGGFFDNPELRFGVNCYGSKPNQSQHDEAKMNQGAPLSPGALEVQKKVAKFRTEASSIGVMPFNDSKWSM
jgi:hypothetical protein